MTKQQQFLMILQTMFLANAINLSLEPEEAKTKRSELSATSASIFMSNAIFASEQIPENMTAADAANEYGLYALNIAEYDLTNGPAWFHLECVAIPAYL